MQQEDLESGRIPSLEPKEEILSQSDRVLIKATQKPAAGNAFYQQLSIKIDTNLIYYDQDKLFTTQFGLLPIIRKIEPPSDTQFEILLGFVGQYEYDRILQLIVDSTRVIRQDTFPMFVGMHQDVDDDGQIEFLGNWFPDLNYCFDCDSSYYNPPAIYEMHPMGFRYDSAAVKIWVEKTYGKFEGYETNKYKVVKLIGE